MASEGAASEACGFQNSGLELDADAIGWFSEPCIWKFGVDGFGGSELDLEARCSGLGGPGGRGMHLNFRPAGVYLHEIH